MSDQFYLKIDKNIDLIWIDDQSFSEIIDKRVHDSSWILDSLVILYTLFYEESNVLMRSFFA